MSENKTEHLANITHLESLLDSSLDVIFRISPTGKINYISASVFDLLGYLPNEILNKSFANFIPSVRLPQYFSDMSILFRKYVW